MSPFAVVFLLSVIDPLLTLLGKVPHIDPRCFADDLAIGFEHWADIKPVFHIIDAFSHCKFRALLRLGVTHMLRLLRMLRECYALSQL